METRDDQIILFFFTIVFTEGAKTDKLYFQWGHYIDSPLAAQTPTPSQMSLTCEDLTQATQRKKEKICLRGLNVCLDFE